jgi:hypothetical protein
MKKIIVALILIFGVLGFSAKTGNNNSYMDKMIGYWYYSKVGYQDPIGIRKLSNGTYQIGFNTWEGNADKNGFEWNDLQPMKNGIFKIKGVDMYMKIKGKGFVFLDKTGKENNYFDTKINKIPRK